MRIIPYMLMAFLVCYLLDAALIPIFSAKGVLTNLIACLLMFWAEMG